MGALRKGLHGAPVSPVPPGAPPQPQMQQMQQPAKLDKLKELKDMLDAGVLTQDEFDAEKRKVLDAPAIQPMMAQPSVQSVNLWNGPPPPKEFAASWWAMYKPDDGKGKIGPDGRFMAGSEEDDCKNCLFACLCPACASGEVEEWATDGKVPQVVGILQFMCCAMCEVSTVRGFSDEKIWKFHHERGGAWTHLRHTCRYSRTRLRVPPRALLACLLAPLPHTFLRNKLSLTVRRSKGAGDAGRQGEALERLPNGLPDLPDPVRELRRSSTDHPRR